MLPTKVTRFSKVSIYLQKYDYVTFKCIIVFFLLDFDKKPLIFTYVSIYRQKRQYKTSNASRCKQTWCKMIVKSIDLTQRQSFCNLDINTSRVLKFLDYLMTNFSLFDMTSDKKNTEYHRGLSPRIFGYILHPFFTRACYLVSQLFDQ